MLRPVPPVLLLLAAACATTGGTPSYSESAEQNFRSGMEEFQDENWQEASQYFEHVRTKFPYSQYAALAELRLADTLFGDERYTDAIDAYKNFIKFRPTHPDVDWASFRIGQAHHEDIPSDFFIFPPSTEKDQTQARAARTALEDFLASHPKSKYRERGQELLADVIERLAQHEVYVARFDESREKWLGAAFRYQHLLAEFPRSPLAREALDGLVRSYRKAGEPQRAKEPLERFLARNPDHPEADAARELLRSLG